MSSTAGPTRSARHRRSRPRGGAPSSTRGAASAALARAPPTQQVAPAPIPLVVARPVSPGRANTSTTRFAEFHERGFISKMLLDNIPFEYCTEVQAATMETILGGVDVFARAKTGTGKTIAFLLPIIQRLSAKLPPGGTVSALIVSPTRDLAQQIQAEAEKLIQNTGLGVQCVIGGTNMRAETSRLSAHRADILVATPGRLLDHMEQSGLRNRLANVKFFVLDEADRLLDQGFAPDIEKIARALPNRGTVPRQSLLFSATVAPKVRKVAELALLPSHKFISTVLDTDEATHEHVPQKYIVLPLGSHFAALASYLAAAAADKGKPVKMIVFVNTAREAELFHGIFDKLRPGQLPAYEMHSRMSQSARTKQTDAFRVSPRGVMFASDVIARGIDIPNVTAVLQMGGASNTDTYVHRLGRTARAGNDGEGLIFLDPSEASIIPQLNKGTLVRQDPPADLANWQATVSGVLDKIPDGIKQKAYSAWIGYNKTSKWNRLALGDLLRMANSYALQTMRYKGDGSGAPPPIPKQVAGKMGIKGPERNLLNIVADPPRESRQPRGR